MISAQASLLPAATHAKAGPSKPFKKSSSPLDAKQRSNSGPPLKKRRLSPQDTHITTNSFPPTYLGEVLITNAWSNVSGKGYVKPNESIQIQRDEVAAPKPGPSKQAKSVNKKTGDGKKQLSLATMLKAQPTNNFKKKKVDTIVRLVNSRGFEFGRLPTECSWWISKLLELGVVQIRGTMSDCPEKLTTGVSLIVTLHFYIVASAFTPLSTSNSDELPKLTFNEGAETNEETSLRERKSAVVKLFEVIGLKPQAGANFKGKSSDGKIHEEALKRMAQHPTKKVKEIVGDGEEIEVEEAEELSKNDIDTIYKRAQHNDRTMSEMEPADTFNLTLRGYQKQALSWMHSLESGKMNAREAWSMHPLWSEYSFPHEPCMNDDIIDLTADEKLFYFNPYSGELSLDFPKAERNCRGGILADEISLQWEWARQSCFLRSSKLASRLIRTKERSKTRKARQSKSS